MTAQKSALITGGAGFIGSHLAVRLLADEMESRVVAQVRDVLLRARRQVVEHEHLPALREQELREM